MEIWPPLHLSVVAIEKEAFGSPSTKVTNFTFYLHLCPSYFFIHIDSTPLRSSVKCIFGISYRLELPGILLMCLAAFFLIILSRSPQVSMTFLSILDDHTNAVVLYQGLGTYLPFRFLSVLPSGQPERQHPPFCTFSFLSFFFRLSLGLVVWPRLNDPFVSQNIIIIIIIATAVAVIVVVVKAGRNTRCSR